MQTGQTAARPAPVLLLVPSFLSLDLTSPWMKLCSCGTVVLIRSPGKVGLQLSWEGGLSKQLSAIGCRAVVYISIRCCTSFSAFSKLIPVRHTNLREIVSVKVDTCGIINICTRRGRPPFTHRTTVSVTQHQHKGKERRVAASSNLQFCSDLIFHPNFIFLHN